MDAECLCLLFRAIVGTSTTMKIYHYKTSQNCFNPSIVDNCQCICVIRQHTFISGGYEYGCWMLVTEELLHAVLDTSITTEIYHYKMRQICLNLLQKYCRSTWWSRVYIVVWDPTREGKPINPMADKDVRVSCVASCAWHARARLSRGFWARLRACTTLSPSVVRSTKAHSQQETWPIDRHAPRVRLLQES